MKNNWWKILGVIIFFYVIIVGMCIPLKPGIVESVPQTVSAGHDKELTIETYNTHLNKAKDLKIFLKFSEDQILAAKSGDILSANKMTAVFDIPVEILSNTSIADATLIVDNEIDGPALMPKALFVKDIDKTQSADVWVGDIRSSLHVKDNFAFPYRSIIHETVRNTFFHVAIWMAMFALLIISVINSILFLFKKEMKYDYRSNGFTSVAIVFGLAGIATGMVWAKYTWGAYWTSDIKLNMAAVTLLLYLAYWLVRSSIDDFDNRARLSAMYNIFAFVALIPLLIIIPRLTDSLHPGNGGNPAMGGEDLDNTLRMVFYPAIIGLTLIGVWMANLYTRYQRILSVLLEREIE